MLIVLDFDGVLFDVEQFKRDYAKVFVRAGISFREYGRSYEQAKKARHGIYNVREHVRVLRNKPTKFSGMGLRRAISSFLVRHARKYFFHDAAGLLRWCRTRGVEVALVSAGSGFQREKISASGIALRVSKVVVTWHHSKVVPLGHLMRKSPDKELVYFDDSARVIDDVKKALPMVHAVQVVRRRNARKSRRADVIINGLADARGIIESVLSRRTPQ